MEEKDYLACGHCRKFFSREDGEFCPNCTINQLIESRNVKERIEDVQEQNKSSSKARPSTTSIIVSPVVKNNEPKFIKANTKMEMSKSALLTLQCVVDDFTNTLLDVLVQIKQTKSTKGLTLKADDILTTLNSVHEFEFLAKKMKVKDSNIPIKYRLDDFFSTEEINPSFLNEEDTEMEQGFHKVFFRKNPNKSEENSSEQKQ